MHGYTIEVMISLMENFIIIQIVNYFLYVKNKKMQYVFILLFSILAQFINTMNSPFNLILPTSMIIIYTLLNYKGLLIIKILISLSVFLVNAFLSYFIITLLEVFGLPVLELIMSDTLLYVCLVFVSKFILITLFFMFRMVIKNQLSMEKFINWKVILIELTVFFISTLYCFYIFVSEIIDARFAMFFMIFQMITVLITIYFFYKYIGILKEQEEYKAEILFRKNYTEKTNEELILFNQNYSMYCDLSNKISQLKMCEKTGDINRMHDLIIDIEKIEFPKRVGFNNEALDFLLNSKYEIMSHYGIAFQAVVCCSMPIDYNDLIYIFGNLLDSIITELKDKKGARVKMEISLVNAGTKVTIESSPITHEEAIANTMKKINSTVSKYNAMSYSNLKNKKYLLKYLFVSGVDEVK